MVTVILAKVQGNPEWLDFVDYFPTLSDAEAYARKHEGKYVVGDSRTGKEIARVKSIGGE